MPSAGGTRVLTWGHLIRSSNLMKSPTHAMSPSSQTLRSLATTLNNGSTARLECSHSIPTSLQPTPAMDLCASVRALLLMLLGPPDFHEGKNGGKTFHCHGCLSLSTEQGDFKFKASCFTSLDNSSYRSRLFQISTWQRRKSPWPSQLPARQSRRSPRKKNKNQRSQRYVCHRARVSFFSLEESFERCKLFSDLYR